MGLRHFVPSNPSVYVIAMGKHSPKFVVEEEKGLGAPAITVAGMDVSPVDQGHTAPVSPTSPMVAVSGEVAAIKSTLVATHEWLDLHGDFTRGWIDRHWDGFDATMALVCLIQSPGDLL